jgi:hypothetical protein
MGTVLPNNGYDHNNSPNFLCQCDVELSQISVSNKKVSLKPVTRLYRPLSRMKPKRPPSRRVSLGEHLDIVVSKSRNENVLKMPIEAAG